MNSHYVVHYTISSLYTIKKHYLSIKGTVFHFTIISLYTIYLEKQKSCKVRATCTYLLMGQMSAGQTGPKKSKIKSYKFLTFLLPSTTM